MGGVLFRSSFCWYLFAGLRLAQAELQFGHVLLQHQQLRLLGLQRLRRSVRRHLWPWPRQNDKLSNCKQILGTTIYLEKPLKNNL